MAEYVIGRSVCVYVQSSVRKELAEDLKREDADSVSSHINRVLHVVAMAGGIRAVEKRLMNGGFAE